MSLKKINQVKADKGFKIWDIVVYAVIALLAAVIFIVVFTTKDTRPLEGVRVYSRGEPVFEYVFDTNEYKILSDSVEIEVTDGEALTVRITAEVGYNTVVIERSGSVKVTDADCRNKDCIYMPELKDNSGIIYCSPHGLRVVPLDYEPDDGIIIV